MIPVKVDQLFISNVGFVILLKGLEDKRVLQIFIGAAEAQAIAIHLNSVEIPRPLTHDLLKNLLDYFECRLKRIEVCDLRDGTFYAKLVLERNGMETEVDSRPSDAIALALRCAAPIFVAEKVMDEAGRILEESPADDAMDLEQKKEANPASALTPLEKLKSDLDRAVKDERYEDAARIRDEIKRLEAIH
jgi:bifunctional DNase/RNase